MSTEPETALGTFGLEMTEMMDAMMTAMEFVNGSDAERAMGELIGVDPKSDKRRSDALRGTSSWLSSAGLSSFILMQRDSIQSIGSFRDVLNRILVHPPCYRDWADWWLFFSALAARVTFQLDRCSNAKSEPRLAGHLLEALAAQGAVWSQPLAPALARIGTRLAIGEIDLEVGGGEQVNGGDFGLILDFDRRTVQPGAEPQGHETRIVPLIFQAKHYRQPNATVSQTNPRRGPQRDLLASNKCASAYIFYDNLGQPTTPLPPLVKSIDKVLTATTTNVLDESLDFATYLLRAATDATYAPRARSTDDALRMIFSKAALRDLSALVVISADTDAARRYRNGLATLSPRLTDRGEEHFGARTAIKRGS